MLEISNYGVIAPRVSNGVLTEGAVATVSASGDTTPPKAPSGLR